jgi:hypothetical protein
MLQGPTRRFSISAPDGSRPVTEIQVSPFVIGRAGDCDLVLDDAQVSPHHAQIEVQPDGRVVLRDLGSEAGTLVGGSRIDGGVWFSVPGSFRVGGTILDIGVTSDETVVLVDPAIASAAGVAAPTPTPVVPYATPVVAAAAVATASAAGTPAPAVLWAPVSDAQTGATTSPVRYRSSRTRALVTMIAIGLAGVIELVSIIHLAGFSGLVDDVVSGAAGAVEADRFDATTSLIAGAYVLVLIVAAIAYVAWLSRAVEDAPALGAGTPPHSPRGAIGWWFVPFASFVVPFQIVADLHDRLATASDHDRARPLLVAWWLTWLGGSFIGYATRLPGDQTVDQLKASVGIEMVSDAVTVVAAVLAILVVRRIVRREDARATALTATDGPAVSDGPAVPDGPA